MNLIYVDTMDGKNESEDLTTAIKKRMGIGRKYLSHRKFIG